MRIYLDTCSVNRPLDDKNQSRIALEAEAILAVLSACDAGLHALVSSDILLFEIGRNPHPQRNALASEIVARAVDNIALTDSIRDRAQVFEKAGIRPLDALHLAAAEAGNVDFFCTCDDRLYKRAKGWLDVQVRVLTPLELAQEVLP
ncbi:MAG: PIN domain-containing protein [Roseiflexaceae bacterium]|nr:PIN domain-containing protein [Roseiflexaceae bacterium]